MMTGDYRAIIGSKVRKERLRLGLSQEELAEKVEVHPSFIGQIERGIKATSFDTLARLGVVFGIKTADFLAVLDTPAAAAKPLGYERKISELLKGLPAREQAAIYQTIRHLLRHKRRFSK